MLGLRGFPRGSRSRDPGSRVKLLLDENLSRRLVPALQQVFPGTSQVTLLGLERSTDAELCVYAASHGFVLCSKDDDFQALAAARGYRPKLIRVALGNVSNDKVLEALISAAESISQALADDGAGVVVLE